MSGIYGALGLNTTDSQLVYVQTIGQQAIYDAVNQTLDQHTSDLEAAMSIFVEGVTEDHKERYMLPGTGRLQRVGPDGRPTLVKATGSWDVAYPLEEFAAAWGSNRIAFAYMTMADLDRHLKTVYQQNINTVRFEILEALLNNADDTFVDPIRGSLTIKALATGSDDGVTYPPQLGSETEQTVQRYVESGYAASAIADGANDPFPTIVNALEANFGTPTGGSRIVVFINNAQTAKVTGLTAFTGVTNRFVDPRRRHQRGDGPARRDARPRARRPRGFRGGRRRVAVDSGQLHGRHPPRCAQATEEAGGPGLHQPAEGPAARGSVGRLPVQRVDLLPPLRLRVRQPAQRLRVRAGHRRQLHRPVRLLILGARSSIGQSRELASSAARPVGA
jgi:hypothetical protein